MLRKFSGVIVGVLALIVLYVFIANDQKIAKTSQNPKPLSTQTQASFRAQNSASIESEEVIEDQEEISPKGLCFPESPQV